MQSDALEKPCKACVVVPTYNNRATVAAAIEEIRAFTSDIIVVDDGSDDGAADILKGIAGITLAMHPRNLGKGAAIATGLARAAQMGFTHAITMDADGQHLAQDLPKLLAAIALNPGALVIGVRGPADSGRRRMSRVLRLNSDFWVSAETGCWIHDAQSGFRAYPLEETLSLTLETTRYDFEIESLVKLIWRGVPVVSVPVAARYGPGSGSHFRPVADLARVARLNARLVAERVTLPASLRRRIHLRAYCDTPLGKRVYEIIHGAVLQESKTPGRFAACVGIGVTFGILPIWGFQALGAAVTAHFLKLSKPLAVAASHVSLPIFIPFILYASLVMGRLLVSHRLDFSVNARMLTPAGIWLCAAEYIVGSIVLAAAAGIATGLASRAIAGTIMESKRS